MEQSMNDIRDERGVPVSKGVPVAVRFAFALGIVVTFIIGGMVIKSAASSHLWPAEKTQTMELK